MLTSPLEQFYIFKVVTLNFFFNITFLTIDNIILTFLIMFLFFFFYIVSLSKSNNISFFLIPNIWQFLLENIFLTSSSLIQENIQYKNRNLFFPIISTIFFSVLSLNLFGIIPYTFTITSQFIVTFTLGLFVFIGIHIIAIKVHKIKILSLFFPSGISVLLSVLLVPVEIISFIFKPISISTRLFVNMMAGHTLLKVIAGFVWTIMSISGLFSIIHIIPLLILVILFSLEIGIAIIQAFVFTVLFCIYINDIFNLH